jgi:hypothetical protein
MAEHLESEPTSRTEASPTANRAQRRATRRCRPPLPRTTGKVRPVRFDHATNPRQFAAHRRG